MGPKKKNDEERKWEETARKMRVKKQENPLAREDNLGIISRDRLA